MIKQIVEVDIKGFHLVYDEEHTGWKCVIGTEEIMFPHMQAASAAINEILKDSEDIIKNNHGIVIRSVCKANVTKTIEAARI